MNLIESKKIWDKLEVTHEETIQVKESNISILVHKYDYLKWKQMNQFLRCSIDSPT